MKQISIFITEQQEEALKKLKERTGISRNEAIRRALDELIKKEFKREEE